MRSKIKSLGTLSLEFCAEPASPARTRPWLVDTLGSTVISRPMKRQRVAGPLVMSVEIKPGETSLGKPIALAMAGETRVPSGGSWPSDITVIQPPGIPRDLGLMVKLPLKVA